MTILAANSVDSWGINFKDSVRVPKVAKLSDCADYAIILDDLNQVQTLRLSTGECWRVPVRGGAMCIAISAQGEFAVASTDGTIQRFDLSLPTICIGKIALSAVTSLSYDRTGTMLVAAQNSGQVLMFDLEIRPLPLVIGKFRVSDGMIPALGTRGDSIFGVDRRGRMFCLRNPLSEPQILWNGAAHFDLDCYTMAVHPYLTRLALGGSGRYVRWYSADNVAPTILATAFSYVRDLVFLPVLNLLAVVGTNGLEVWNLDTNSLVLNWKSSKGRIIGVCEFENRLRVLYG
ncbi:MAG: WD40 repeat domain-containing protein [Candidatus Melainabacteria bacterium]|nr:MAG: WD40 repeat domain-containing protein [Candidatus Melainabacteria bacterium]